MADLKAGEQQDVTLPMLSRPGKDDHVSGEIQLRITYTPLEVRVGKYTRPEDQLLPRFSSLFCLLAHALCCEKLVR